MAGSLSSQVAYAANILVRPRNCAFSSQKVSSKSKSISTALLDIELVVVYSWWRQLKRSAPELLEALGYRVGFTMMVIEVESRQVEVS